MIFKELEAFKGRSSGDELVRELGLVFIPSTVGIHLLVSVFGFT